MKNKLVLVSGFCAALLTASAFAGHLEALQQGQQIQIHVQQQTPNPVPISSAQRVTQEQWEAMPGMLVVRVKVDTKGQESQPVMIPLQRSETQNVTDSSGAQKINQAVQTHQSFPVQDCGQQSSCASAPQQVQQMFQSQRSIANSTPANQGTWDYGARWSYWAPYYNGWGFYGYGSFPYYGYGYGNYSSYYPYNYYYNPYLYANYGLYYGDSLYPYSYAGYFHRYGGYNYYYYYNPYYY